jgi:hypothetical protein
MQFDMNLGTTDSDFVNWDTVGLDNDFDEFSGRSLRTGVVSKYLIPLNRIRIEMPLDGGDGVSEQMIGVLR